VKRCFHSATVAELQPSAASIAVYGTPSASINIIRARRASSARTRWDRARRSNSERSSGLSCTAAEVTMSANISL
jgi:hypothetical protein